MTRSHKPFDTDAPLLTIYNLYGADVGVLAVSGVVCGQAE